MTLQHTQAPRAARTAGKEADFDLDLSIVSAGPVVADLMRSTDDGCGSSCQSACANSGC